MDELPFSRSPVPWSPARGLATVLEAWRADPGLWRNVRLYRVVPPHEGQYTPLPEALHPAVQRALRRRGIDRLYAHQARAFELARNGRSLVVATPTASGKSLCYHLPVLDRLAREPEARALYLFPTKALSRDQEASLRETMRDVGLAHGAITYDGDTPGDARRAAKERSGIVLTNPDMLHAGILPHHASWARFFAALRFVVIDELHTYRGVFGSHFANVLRRLQRIARFHGSDPVFVCASATIGNPEEHARRMLGRAVELIGESAAPSGPRHVLVYDPPVLVPELGIRASYLKSAVSLAADLLRAEVPTLIFGQSRNAVEVMLKYLRDRLASARLDPESVQGYRGGYLPDTRRRIEQGLRSGAIRGVVATNALELGIDIGSLEAVVCAGYPGSMAALWQRFGRAGRRHGPSLALLVASSQPLDQYIACQPEMLVGAPIEHARIDPDNVEILIQHLQCAAFELPFDEGDALGDVSPEAVRSALDYLAQHRVVHPGPGPSGRTRYHWASDAYPATHVSLRSASWDNFVIIDLQTDRAIAEMDWRAAHTMLHEQAIYQQEGEQYQVEKLDFQNHKAFVRKVEPDYYTTALVEARIAVVHEDDGAIVQLDPTRLGVPTGLGEISVVEKVVGYKKIKFHTHENIGYGEVRLPDMQMHTSAFWVTFPQDVVGTLPAPRALVIDAIRGIASAMQVVASVGLMCDPRDLGQAIGEGALHGELPSCSGRPDATFHPTIFLYDHVPGGIGLAPRLFSDREALLRRTRTLIERCGCDGGCPACVGAPIGAPLEAPVPTGSQRSNPRVATKRLALDVLEAIGISSTH